MHSKYYQYVGQQLRQYRINCGYSLETVAERVGLSKKTIANYETAMTKISPDMIKQLCRVYGIDYMSFMQLAIISM